MKHIHFIAIGGAAMHNLAIALHKNGARVTGSDDHIFDPARSNLSEFGMLPAEEGWFPEKITKQIDIVILGMHARADNPELLRARELGLDIQSFPEFIFTHAANKKRIVVGGSHGKTSITGMILHVFAHCGIESDYLLGAAVPGFDGNVRLSDSAKVMVIEGDEYLTSPMDLKPKFHHYRPHIAVISGIAWDHINVFKTFDDYVNQFKIFADLIEPDGALIYCSLDHEVVSLVDGLKKSIDTIPYGLPDFIINNGKTVLLTPFGEIQLLVFGEHNLQNIEAARNVCLLAGVDPAQFYTAISSWKGAYNRLTCIFDEQNQTVFRDFAHAPSKVKATVEAVRKQFPNRKFIACLELHTFSSLSAEFIPQYLGSMDLCDCPFLYFNPHAVQLKKLSMPDPDFIKKSFGNERLMVFTEIEQLKCAVNEALDTDFVILYMSSGNFDDLNPVSFVK